MKVADHLNSYFTNIASDLADKHPKGTGKFNTDSMAFKDFYKSEGVDSSHFRLSPVTQDLVLNELSNLSVNRSTGLDNIPARFLKDGAPELKKPMTHVINLSIATNTVPDDFKIACVQPLFKKNSKFDVSN